jgi:hypothetical protein
MEIAKVAKTDSVGAPLRSVVVNYFAVLCDLCVNRLF